MVTLRVREWSIEVNFHVLDGWERLVPSEATESNQGLYGREGEDAVVIDVPRT